MTVIPITLIVENPESSEPRLKIFLENENQELNSCSYRKSTIFSAFSDNQSFYLPGKNKPYKIYFFFPKSTFSSLGFLNQKLGNYSLESKHDVLIKSCIWISHGLASIILITNDEKSIVTVREILEGIENNLIAIESWDINSDGIIKTKYEIFIDDNEIEPIYLEKWDFKDPDLDEIINECEVCLNTLRSRIFNYSPKLLTVIKEIKESIDSLLNKLRCLEEDKYEKLDQEIHDDILLNKIYKLEWHHRIVSELIEYNSIMSYVISQAFSGHIPILHNESQIRNHSLLGIGNSFKTLSLLYLYVNSAFEIISFKKLFELFGEFPISEIEISGSHKVEKWPEIKIASFNKLLAKNKKHLVYFSGRTGFRETSHAIISAMQTISSADSIRWSLIVNTHEYMHAIVRALLSDIFPRRALRDTNYLNELLNLYKLILGKKYEGSVSIKQFIQILFVHYLHLRTQRVERINIFEKYKKTTRLYLDRAPDEYENRQENQSRDFISASKTTPINIGNFKDIITKEWSNINEILAHTLDFLYFYDTNPSIYIPAIWLSWSTVPSVIEQTEEYVLRTVSVIASLEQDQMPINRFKAACQVVEKQLRHIFENTGNKLVERALKVFKNSSIIKLMGHCFMPNIYLVDFVFKYLNYKQIKDKLGEPGQGFTDVLIPAGTYDLKDISNPVYFIKERLVNLINKDMILDSKNEKFSSLWLLLSCSSLYSEG